MCQGQARVCLSCCLEELTWHRCPRMWTEIKKNMALGLPRGFDPHPRSCPASTIKTEAQPVGLCPDLHNEENPCGSWVLAVQNRYASEEEAKLREFLRLRKLAIEEQARRRFEKTGVFLKKPVENAAPPPVSLLSNAIFENRWGLALIEQKNQEEIARKKRARVEFQRAKHQEIKFLKAVILKTNEKKASPPSEKALRVIRNNRQNPRRISKRTVHRANRVYHEILTIAMEWEDD